MTEFNGTGKFATPEERQRILEAIREYQQLPDIAFSTKHALEHGGVRGDAKEGVHVLIDEIAISHGLPEYEGHYGFNPDTLEFNKPT